MNRTLSRRQLIKGVSATLIANGSFDAGKAMASSKVYAAAALVDSIGVCVHLSYSNTVYGHFDDIIFPRLVESGLRHVRDGLPTGPKITGREWLFQRGRKLVGAGLRFSCVTGFADEAHGAVAFDSLARSIGYLDNGVVFLEGPNEPNLGKLPGWPQLVRDSQKNLYEHVKSSPDLRNISILGPSITQFGGKPVGDISAWMDFGNIHCYPGGSWPEAGNLDTHIKDAATTDGDKPLVATETGYHSALETKHGHPAISEPMIARYLPRLAIWNFAKGIRRSYLYEFADTHDRGLTDQESNFGLVRPNGEAKPGYYAIKNLISLFADPHESAETRELSFTVETQNKDVKTAAFQRSDGDYLLAFWLGVRGWDKPTMSILEPASGELTIVFPGPMQFVDTTRFDDAGEISVEKNAVVAPKLLLTVSDRLAVLRVRRPK